MKIRGTNFIRRLLDLVWIIWRAQIVFLASALDFYMHELTKYGLCEIYNENWASTDKYKNLQVKMEVIEVALKSGEDIDWFLEYINSYYRAITMVSYEFVKDQRIRIIR